jgi:hypothetical protein
MKIDKELNTLIISAINAGICADVHHESRMHDNSTFYEEHIHSATDGYDFKKTLKFIADKIEAFNHASKHHSSQK